MTTEIQPEIPAAVGFNLNAIPGIKEWVQNAGRQIFEAIQDGTVGKFKLTVAVTINSDDLAITAKCKTSLPQPDTITLPTVYAIRQNKTLEVEQAAAQVPVFGEE